MTTIATLTIEMAANLARLKEDMDRAKSTVGDAMKNIESVVGYAKTAFIGLAGVASAGAFAGMIRDTIDATAKLNDLAMQTGATVESLSAMASIGKTSDTGIETIANAMNKLAKNMAGATEESKGTAKAIQALGIDFQTFKGLGPDEQMQAVAKAMDGFADGSGKAAAAMALYGKEGAKMLPFLKDLADTGELVAKVTAEQAAMADNFSDNLTKLQASGQGWKKELSMGMLPALNDASQAMLDVFNSTGGVRDELRKLAADGTIAEWTRMAITGLTYVSDAVTYLWRGFQTLGKGLGAYAAAAAAAASGEWSQAGNILKELGTDLSKTWSEETLGQRLRSRMDELKSMGSQAAETKPKLDFTDVLEKNKEAADKQTKAYKDLLTTLREKVAAGRLELEVGGKLTESQKLQLDITKKVEQGVLRLTDANSQETKQLLEKVEAMEQAKETQQALSKAAEEAWKDYLKNTEALQKNVEAINQKTLKQLEENTTIGKTRAELDLLELARLKEEQRVMAEIVAKEELIGVCTRETIAHQDTLEALNKLISAKEEGVHLKAAKEAADEWQRTAKTIESDLTNALMRGFESGKGFFVNLRDTVVNMFKTLVLRPIIQPVAQGMAGGLMGLMGMPAQAGTGGGGITGLSGLDSLLSGGMNFLNGSSIKSGASGLWTRAGDWMSTSGNNTMAGMGDWMQANGQMGSMLGMAGNGLAGYGLGKMANGMISGGYQMSSGMTSFQSIGAGVAGAIMGPLGGAIAGGISGLANRAFGRKLADQGVEGSFSGGGFNGDAFKFFKGGWFRSDKTEKSALDADMAGALGAGAGAIYQQVKAYAEALGLPAQELAGITSKMRVSFTDDAEKNRQAIADAVTAYGTSLTDTFADQLRPFQKAGESLIETMQRLSVLQFFSESINQLGGIFSTIAGSSVGAREGLIELAGGIDALMGKAQAFVRDYYSQAEQAGMQARDIKDRLAAVGVDASQFANKDDFRAFVERLNVETQAGREQLNSMLDLAPQFAQLSEYIKANNTTFEEVLKNAPQTALLDKMLTPAERTANTTTQIAEIGKTGNELLSGLQVAVRDGTATTASAIASLAGSVSGMAAVAQAAVAAANAAADSASAAVRAANAAADNRSLENARPGDGY